MDDRADTTGEQASDPADRIKTRFDDSATEAGKRFDEVDQRFDDMNRGLARQRERMVKLEGPLAGFLAGGRRDRAAA